MAKVFLSAGHGGSDPGAVGYGMKEKDINLQVMLACQHELARHGVSVAVSRTKDENDPVTQEVNEANASGAVIAVSFHTNAGRGDGSESYYWQGDAKGLRLAQLCEKYTKLLGQNSRGVKPGNHLWFVKATKMTAVLCEIGFIDNDKDNDIFDTLVEQKAFGIAYAKAILEYLGIAYKESTSAAGSTPAGSFLIKAKTPLNIRKGPGVEYRSVAVLDTKYKYTIVETRAAKDGGTWGKLKSGAGYVNVGGKYVTRV